MRTNPICDFFYVVNKINKNYDAIGKKAQDLWAERMRENFKKGYYDIAYEYVAIQELLLFKTMKKTDPFRLKVWRMFVGDFRRAFSDYEYANFQRLKDFNLI